METASDSVPIASFVPLMMFAVLFGLSMDYQVFLLSRSGTTAPAVRTTWQPWRQGLPPRRRVITAAALIMVCVFGSFILNGDPTSSSSVSGWRWRSPWPRRWCSR